MEESSSPLRRFANEDDVGVSNMNHSKYRRPPSHSLPYSTLSPPRASSVSNSQHKSPAHSSHSSYITQRRARQTQAQKQSVVSSEHYQIYESPNHSPKPNTQHDSILKPREFSSYLPSQSAGGSIGVG
eukprot:3406114-Ditylum_brightwellii.AAC.1